MQRAPSSPRSQMFRLCSSSGAVRLTSDGLITSAFLRSLTLRRLSSYITLSEGREGSVPVKAWVKGVPVEQDAVGQLMSIAKLPIVHSHVAAMPDMHLGKGACVGCVVPTVGAIIPAAVGVDIGCGMMAVRTTISAKHLPDSLKTLRTAIEQAVPHGRTNQVHVWAGISLNGASDIAIFTGIMDSEFYQQILQQYLLPFIANKYPDHHRFQQDNDPKHTSHSTRAWMTANHVNHWPTPPESPDLNPIENLWAKLKHHLSKEVKPRTKEQLVAGIKTVWRTMTPDVCRSYIGHLGKVIPAVIANNGNASGY